MLASADRWGDYPTWVAAIGTVAAVFAAIGLAARETWERRRERERQQAELVTAWLESIGGPTPDGLRPSKIVVTNGSQQLVYRFIASQVPVRGAIREDFRSQIGAGAWEFRAFKGELPPGRTDLDVTYPGGGGHIRFAIELAFRDAGGRSWIRTAQGELKRIRGEPADHYGIHEPIDW